MLKVVFYLNKNNNLCGFQITGHSGYGEYGSDIVCAAVSALTINTVNSIKCFSSDIFNLEYEDEGGLMILTMDKESRDYPSAETLLLLQSLELGLKNIQKDYNNNISISYKEV
ncbi:MAG: ribosomal-processing cysteine protease Prp [Epulopiscium sp.]|jgi:uncharacterized protein YsxB (DUF464 family)|nr:ribosomal-processing cysteine protease Prp [Candidatus Epulonipiscium sp.]